MKLLRHVLNRASIHLAVRFPNVVTIAVMCRLNAMPFHLGEVRESLAIEHDEPLDMS